MKILRLFFFVLIFSIGCSNNYYLVERVIDGDTIVLENGERIRYIGIDTPELKGNEYMAIEAKEVNEKLVKNKKVKIEYDIEKKDYFGRTLAYVYCDGVFINAELIRTGHAISKKYPPNIKFAKIFDEIEKDAKKKKLGLWKNK